VNDEAVASLGKAPADRRGVVPAVDDGRVDAGPAGLVRAHPRLVVLDGPDQAQAAQGRRALAAAELDDACAQARKAGRQELERLGWEDPAHAAASSSSWRSSSSSSLGSGLSPNGRCCMSPRSAIPARWYWSIIATREAMFSSTASTASSS